MSPVQKSIPERAEAIADSDKRQWAKAADLHAELEDGVSEAAQTLFDAIETLGTALSDKESAMEETGENRADGLATAWDYAVEALQNITEAAGTILAGLA